MTIGTANPHRLKASPLFGLRRYCIADEQCSEYCHRYVKGDHFYPPSILDLLSE
jgi:hypothetical protein